MRSEVIEMTTRSSINVNPRFPRLPAFVFPSRTRITVSSDRAQTCQIVALKHIDLNRPNTCDIIGAVPCRVNFNFRLFFEFSGLGRSISPRLADFGPPKCPILKHRTAPFYSKSFTCRCLQVFKLLCRPPPAPLPETSCNFFTPDKILSGSAISTIRAGEHR